jgi:hypothetical protein
MELAQNNEQRQTHSLTVFPMGPLFRSVLLGLVVGCSQGNPGLQQTSHPRTPASVVEAWANLGMYLPPAEDIAFLRANLPDSLGAIREGLTHDNESIRMRSAYVAEALGPEARSLVPDLLWRLQSDSSFIVRVYAASALPEIGQLDADGIQKLRDRFRTEEHPQVKTDLAGVLVRLRTAQDEPDAWQWLLHSLKAFPPNPPADGDEQHIFWEQRWGAVKHLRHVRGHDEELLPLLEALKANPKTPGWIIDQQVDAAITEIESRTRRSVD